jgi:cyclomaltodextrinase / maltogenic alpha-amylase / neopullulanase
MAGIYYPDKFFGQLLDPEVSLAMYLDTLKGVRHLNRCRPLDLGTRQPLELTVTTSGPQPFDAVRCWFTTDSDTVQQESFDLVPSRVAWNAVLGDYLQTWTGTLAPQAADVMIRYQIAARIMGTDQWVYADNQTQSAAQATRFSHWAADAPTPSWARTATIYHIFVDRFNPGNGSSWNKTKILSDFFGGTLRGVIEKLDYIKHLGFTAIWLSPIFPSPTHHGYDATDYFSIEPRLGTMDDFQELVNRAHALEIRIILDFVANHCSDRHPAFQSAVSDPNSVYRSWFTWADWPDQYNTYFGIRELPQLNLGSGPAREHLLNSARFWLEQGVDGFRLDHAYGPSHDFWADFQRACRETSPDCWLLGEVMHTPEKQLSYAQVMDGTMDFMLCRALRETFGHGNWNLAQFEAFLAHHESFFPPDFSRPAFLDNHDMNRFLFMSNGNKTKVKLAALALFSLEGPPIVYNGTETGVTQERQIHQNDFGIYEEARLPMNWGAEQDLELLEYFRRLIKLRNDHLGKMIGQRKVMILDDNSSLYAYERRSDDEYVIVAFNLGSANQNMLLRGCSSMQDMLNDCRCLPVDDGVVLELPAMTGAFMAGNAPVSMDDE